MWDEISSADTGPPPVPFKMDFCQSFFCFLLGFFILFGTLPAIRPTEETIYAAGNAMKDFFLCASDVGQIILFDWSRQLCQSIDVLARCFGNIVLSYYTDLLPPIRSHSYAWLLVAWIQLCSGCKTVWEYYKARREFRPEAPAEVEAQPQPLFPTPPPRIQRQYFRRQKKAGNKARRLAESHKTARDLLSCFKGISANIKHIKTNMNTFNITVDTLNTDMTDMQCRLDNTNRKTWSLDNQLGNFYNQFCDVAEIVDQHVAAAKAAAVVTTKRSVVAPTSPSPPPRPLSFKMFHVAQQEPSSPAATISRYPSPTVEDVVDDETTQQSSATTDGSLIDLVSGELPEVAAVAEDQEHEHEHEKVQEDVPNANIESSSTVESSVEVVTLEQEEESVEVPEKVLLKQEEQHEEVPLISSESASTNIALVECSASEKEIEHEKVREGVPPITTESTSEPEAAVDASDNDSLFEGSLPDYEDTLPDPTTNTEKSEEQEVPVPDPTTSTEKAEEQKIPVSAAQEEASKKDREALAASEGDPDKLGPVMRAFHDWQRQQGAMEAQSEVSEDDRSISEQSIEWANAVSTEPAKLEGRVIKTPRSRRPLVKKTEKAIETLSSQEAPASAASDAQVDGPTVTMENGGAKATSSQPLNIVQQIFPSPSAFGNQVDESTGMKESKSVERFSILPKISNNHMLPAPAAVHHHDIDWTALLDRFEHLEPSSNQALTSDAHIPSTPAAIDDYAEQFLRSLQNDPVFNFDNQLLNIEGTSFPAPADADGGMDEYDPYQPEIVTGRTYNDSNAPQPLPAVNDSMSTSYDPAAYNYQGIQQRQQQRQIEEQQHQQQQQQQYFASSLASQSSIPGLTMLQEEEEKQQHWQWQPQLPPQPQDVAQEQQMEQQGLMQQEWKEFDEASGTTNIDQSNIDPRLFESSSMMMMMMMDENDYIFGAGGEGDVMGDVEQTGAKITYDTLEQQNMEGLKKTEEESRSYGDMGRGNGEIEGEDESRRRLDESMQDTELNVTDDMEGAEFAPGK